MKIIETDKSCEHILGERLPHVTLPLTNGLSVTLSKLVGTTVVFCYPMTSKPGADGPVGWDKIPGAKGCTIQNCSYKDNFSKFLKLNASIYGMSTQDTDYQREMAERLRLPFPIISDAKFEFCNSMRIPTFTVDNKRLMKRVTLVIENGVIEAVHFPISQTASDPNWVISFLTSRV